MKFSIALIALMLASPNLAHAYIDPGTGTLLAQSIIAAIATLAVTAKFWWAKLTAILNRRKDKDSSTTDNKNK